MQRTLVLLSLLALSPSACSGGLTGEIASPACETPLGVVDVDEVHPSVGQSARERFEAVGGPVPVDLRWTDDALPGVEITLEHATDLSRDAQILGGDECAAYPRVSVRLHVSTADGRIDHALVGDADLHAARTDIRVEAFVTSLPDFDPADFVSDFDREGARVIVRVELAGDAVERIAVELEPGIEGAERVEIAS